MYSTLKAEKARRGLTWLDLAELSGINYNTLLRKTREGDFTVAEAVSIKKALGVSMTLEELFCPDDN